MRDDIVFDFYFENRNKHRTYTSPTSGRTLRRYMIIFFLKGWSSDTFLDINLF